MEKYKDMTIRKKSFLKLIRNLIIFILLIVFTFWFIFKDQDINELINTIKQVDIKFILLAVLAMFLSQLTESYNIKKIIYALQKKKLSIIKTLKFTWVGFFFSAITPASSGGQPVEIYYMAKEKVTPANATLTMLLELCGFEIASITVSIICAILRPQILTTGIIWFYLLGVLFNTVLLTFMLLGIFSSKANKKITDFTIKILTKLKVKSLDKKIEKINESAMQYNESSKFIKTHKIEFTKSVLRVFIQILFFHSVPFFIYKAFGLTGNNFIDLYCEQAILYITVAAIPLPGSIGISETLFLKIFGLSFGKEIIKSAMLLSRFSSFYLYVIITSVVVIITTIKGKNIKSPIDENIEYIDGPEKGNIMAVEKQLNKNELIVKIDGRLDTNSAQEVENQVKDLKGVKTLIFDLKDLKYISSAGLRILLACQKEMEKQGTMKIINANSDVKEIFEVTGFDEILTIE